ncbi:MAG: hypothetical protein PHT94_00485 [Candidatus Nanoarchaeia archaeon]|nr:hypothetical protein [Candidatus Nanoarchaeia archaeon]
MSLENKMENIFSISEKDLKKDGILYTIEEITQYIKQLKEAKVELKGKYKAATYGQGYAFPEVEPIGNKIKINNLINNIEKNDYLSQKENEDILYETGRSINSFKTLIGIGNRELKKIDRKKKILEELYFEKNTFEIGKIGNKYCLKTNDNHPIIIYYKNKYYQISTTNKLLPLEINKINVDISFNLENLTSGDELENRRELYIYGTEDKKELQKSNTNNIDIYTSAELISYNSEKPIFLIESMIIPEEKTEELNQILKQTLKGNLIVGRKNNKNLTSLEDLLLDTKENEIKKNKQKENEFKKQNTYTPNREGKDFLLSMRPDEIFEGSICGDGFFYDAYRFGDIVIAEFDATEHATYVLSAKEFKPKDYITRKEIRKNPDLYFERFYHTDFWKEKIIDYIELSRSKDFRFYEINPNPKIN